jgi:hypothetical protein
MAIQLFETLHEHSEDSLITAKDHYEHRTPVSRGLTPVTTTPDNLKGITQGKTSIAELRWMILLIFT